MSPTPDPLFPVRFPKPVEEEVVVYRRPDGTLAARTRKEFDELVKAGLIEPRPTKEGA